MAGLILILLNIGTIAAPVAGIALVYQDDISQIIIPPQLSDMINEAITIAGNPITLVKFINAEFNTITRTATLTVNFTNPLDYTLSLKSLTTECQCTEHNIPLGQFNLPNPIDLPPTETTTVNIFCSWTQSAQDHFEAAHKTDATIDVTLMGFTANFNEVNLQLSDPISFFNIPII